MVTEHGKSRRSLRRRGRLPCTVCTARRCSSANDSRCGCTRGSRTARRKPRGG